MEKKQDKRIDNTYRALYNSLKKLLIHKSADQITIKELCAEANIQRSTFYSHYNNINELMDAFINGVLLDIEKEIFCVSLHSECTPALFFEKLFLSLSHKPDICRVLLSRSMGHAFANKIIMIIRIKCMQEWRRDFSLLDENNAALVFEFFSAGMFGILNRWISTGQKENQEVIAQLIKNMISKAESVLDTIVK